MSKSVLIFFLPLCLLFSGNYNHLSARSSHSHTDYRSTQLSKKPEKASFGIIENSQTIIQKDSPASADDHSIDATEIDDDDELVPAGKYVEITNNFFTLFYNQLSGNLSQYHKDRLPFCKHFSYFSSSKYIIHRVIRI